MFHVKPSWVWSRAVCPVSRETISREGLFDPQAGNKRLYNPASAYRLIELPLCFFLLNLM